MAKRSKAKNEKTKILANAKPNFGPFYVPKENVVNLKEIYEKEEKESREKSTVFSRFFSGKQHSPKVAQSDPKRQIIKPKPLIIDQGARPRSKPEFVWVVGWSRALATFVFVCLLLVAPLYLFIFFGQINEVKGKVLGVSFQAYDYLQQAQENAQNLNIDQAQTDFNKAADSFASARSEMGEVNSLLLKLGELVPVQGSKVKTGTALLQAGQALSEAGSDIAAAIAPLLNNDLSLLIEDKQQDTNLAETLIYSYDYLEPALLKIKLANQYLKDVDPKAIPEEYREKIGLVTNTLPQIEKSFTEVMNILDVLLNMLGKEHPQRYLVLFQNNHEIRPTGGFIGSFALVDIAQGEIQTVEVPGGGPYEINTYLKEKVIAPEPLHLVNPHWFMQDANWFPDWPESADKIMWFYENSGGPTVDGVMTFTPTVLENLLKITGPIAMPEYEVIVDADNIVDITQNIVEVEYDKETNTPKKFIADLFPVLLDRVFSGEALAENALDILKVFHQSLNEKFILLNFQNQEMQEKVIELGWGGEVKDAPSDYLMVINTNVAGGKTDGVIDEIIEHQAEIKDDGSIIDTVTINRIHRGQEGDLFSGVTNVDYLRLYVPQGSELLEIEGYQKIDPWRFQMPEADYQSDADLRRLETNSYIDDKTKTRISDQFGKTVFGNWLAVDPGQSATMTITYKLPFTIDERTDRYSLLMQKQPGSLGSFVISQVSFPDIYRAIWSYPDNTLQISGNKANFEHDLATDQFYGLIFKQ
ncbi:DUF4012 domain-containing protein [Patescibacteria group bacterium]|nr:DUF4012 domain-containing protein [Patescibacteria group bacterium]